uniref:Erythroid differentiation-related factor 1 n=1 Tax=Peronospora matthiolae TaxID=2874970 RepID=A0AAV1TLQ4_9STRA
MALPPDDGVASFSLPVSPTTHPSSHSDTVTYEYIAHSTEGVHISLPSSPLLSSSSPSSPSSSGSVSHSPVFPLILWETDHGPNDHLTSGDVQSPSSSAVVPFQKLQLNTNLNDTMLPGRIRDKGPRSRTSSSGSYAGSLSSGSESPRTRETSFSATQQFASEFLGIKTETLATGSKKATTTSTLSQELMNVLLRLGDLTQQEGKEQEEVEEPQLSVRLRGGQVELLTSAAEDEDVDFLGPAENIKKLFKLPYSHARVSLAVHRVGTTLVVDGELEENDVPAGLFEDGPQDTLRWVQYSDEMTQRLLYEKFIYESTVNTTLPVSETKSPVHDTETGEQKQRKSKQHRTAKNRTSKLKKTKQNKQKTEAQRAVEHGPRTSERSQQLDLVSPVQEKELRPDGESMQSADLESSHGTKYEAHPDDNLQRGTKSTTPSSQQDSRPSFIRTGSNCQASAAQYSPLHAESQMFQRILKWKFNDLKMILGSQVLLFSNPEHPAVSLKLHDMDKELSLCTVLDYYLDNVIANIPELAVCMHSKGLVRGYKLVETRQIPYMSSTGRPLFDVQDVSMNASTLLKFLQENCSRPNGTYWLHRKEGEASLRLYDVDVLSQGSQLKWKYMMAMLCYRFAARASRLSSSLAAGTPQLQQQLQQRERNLLCTCMRLLGEIAQKGGAAHGSICSSVSEQLADTYIRECNQIHAFNSTESTSVDSDREAAIRLLEKAKQYLLASIKLFEECIPKNVGPALTHTNDELDGSAAIEGNDDELAPEDEDENGEMGNFMDEELNRLQLKFSSACLELGHLYARDHKWIDAVKSMVEAGQFLTLSSIPGDVEPLDLSSREQDVVFDRLLEKLDFDGVGRAGLSHGKIRICESGAELRCSLLGLIGDMAAQKPAGVYDVLAALYDVVSGVKRDQLPCLCDHASELLKALVQTAGSVDDKTLASSVKDLLMLSFLAYLRALSPPANSELYFMMMKKLGNASNELGKYSLAVESDYKEAFRWFERGCKIFSDIEDGVNVALLRANLAHLHKMFAQGESADKRVEHYETAIRLCTEALQLLKQSKADMDLHRKVKGELALTYLVWAVDMANSVSTLETTRPALTKERENEALKVFNKALSLYAELGDQKQTASTHYQIASFYSRMISSTLRSERDNIQADKCDRFSSTLVSRMEIARRHYEKALHYFGAAEVGKTFVLIHQELADLHILGGRFEGIEHALLILLSTYEAFNVGNTNKTFQLEDDQMALLARGIVAKVKAVLHQLIRLSSSECLVANANGSASKTKKLEMFKKMYKEMIYYDESNASSVVPILGALQDMCIL